MKTCQIKLLEWTCFSRVWTKPFSSSRPAHFTLCPHTTEKLTWGLADMGYTTFPWGLIHCTQGWDVGGILCSPDPPRLVSRSSRFQWRLQLQLQSTDLDPNFPKQCSDDLVPCWKEPALNFKTEIRAKLPQSLGMFWSSGFGLSPSLIWTI